MELEYVVSRHVLNKIFLVSSVDLYILGGKSLVYWKACFLYYLNYLRKKCRALRPESGLAPYIN